MCWLFLNTASLSLYVDFFFLNPAIGAVGQVGATWMGCLLISLSVPLRIQPLSLLFVFALFLCVWNKNMECLWSVVAMMRVLDQSSGYCCLLYFKYSPMSSSCSVQCIKWVQFAESEFQISSARLVHLHLCLKGILIVTVHILIQTLFGPRRL